MQCQSHWNFSFSPSTRIVSASEWFAFAYITDNQIGIFVVSAKMLILQVIYYIYGIDRCVSMDLPFRQHIRFQIEFISLLISVHHRRLLPVGKINWPNRREPNSWDYIHQQKYSKSFCCAIENGLLNKNHRMICNNQLTIFLSIWRTKSKAFVSNSNAIISIATNPAQSSPMKASMKIGFTLVFK